MFRNENVLFKGIRLARTSSSVCAGIDSGECQQTTWILDTLPSKPKSGPARGRMEEGAKGTDAASGRSDH